VKITIEQAEETKVITLTSLQEKALTLLTDSPINYIEKKMTSILDFMFEQAKQKFAKHEIDGKTEKELEVIADVILAEETIKPEEEKQDE